MRSYTINNLVSDTVEQYNANFAITPEFQYILNINSIRRWAILPRPFTYERDEITYTDELRRDVIEEHYKDVLDSLYGASFMPKRSTLL